MAIVTDALEGVIDNVLWFHYDITNDVLYMRIADHRETPTTAEETDEGLLLRSEQDDRAVGLTIVNWWKRYGQGALPDSMQQLAHEIEPWAKKLAA